MSNSSLVSYTRLSPNNSGKRTHAIDRISPHCIVGQWSCETAANFFDNTSVEASCNYAIGSDGRMSLVVNEDDRSWCTSSRDNDQRAVTIECASDATSPYAMTEDVYESLVDLCTDICKRNGKSKLLWFGDKSKSLSYEPKSDEVVITVHRWFASKACPGDWLYSRLGNLAKDVTNELNPDTPTKTPADPAKSNNLYRVQTGAFTSETSAEKRAEELNAKGFKTCIVKVDNLYKVQVGAYSKKVNATAMVENLKDAGYNAIIVTEDTTLSPSKKPEANKKTEEEIAQEVLAGKWGNGAERKSRIEAAGYDYDEVQEIVNKTAEESVPAKPAPEKKPEPAPKKKSNEEIAKEVIRGDWGNGEDRKKKLEAAGYDYDAIQDIINGDTKKPESKPAPEKKPEPKPSPKKKSNEEIAKEVIRGDWGNGTEREKKLEAAGYDYDAIQDIINGDTKKPAPAKPAPKKKTEEDIAREIVQDGKWGTGDARKKNVEAAGYDYNKVQKCVNDLMK